MSPIQVHDVNITISPTCCNNDSCPNCCTKSPDTPEKLPPFPVDNKVQDIAMAGPVFHDEDEAKEYPIRPNAPDVTKERKRINCCVIM